MELSEEEKEAIETLKEVASDDFDTLGDDISPKMAQNILSVISSQRKEIEEQKNNELDYTTIYINGVYEGKKYYKDKIREIFQFYIERDSLFNDDPHKMAVITLKDVLNELLEEK